MTVRSVGKTAEESVATPGAIGTRRVRHAGVSALLVYYAAHVLSQPLSLPLPVGGLTASISLTHVVIVGTVVTMIPWLGQGLRSQTFLRIAIPLVLFLAANVLSALQSGEGVGVIFTIGANTVWLLVVGSALTKPMPFAEARRLMTTSPARKR